MSKVKNLTTEMVMCRTVGHAWDEFAPMRPKPSFGWRFSLRCTRCTAERHDIIDRLGQVADRQYLYPDGYKIVGERLERGNLRLEIKRRRQRSFSKAV